MVKFTPQQAMKAQSGRSMPLSLGKRTSNHCTEAGWAPGPVSMGTESLAPPPGFNPQNIQPIANHYTDHIILIMIIMMIIIIYYNL